MEIYLIIVVIMLALGAADLVVGVANDAVNFTNSAVGSRVATRNTIIWVAAAGILLGAVSSSGMMEVARKSFFHPEMYSLADLMYLFLAVMITDIILLDLYNTLGLPTSTTVSMVFELIGAAIAIALLKSGSGSEAMAMINATGALTVISGIVVSVIIAFTVGMIVQFLARLLFTFHLENTMKYFGAAFASIALTVITLYIFLKGFKEAFFMTKAFHDALVSNLVLISVVMLVVFFIVAQFLILKKQNVFKYLILIGTGALAMAFAGNDLVNFIGVPIASYVSYTRMAIDGGPDASAAALGGEAGTPLFFLIIAAIIMVLTLRFSKKAQTVTKTEISLSSHQQTVEMFSPNPMARAFVQIFHGVGKFFLAFVPDKLLASIDERFKHTYTQDKEEAFDILRGSVNIFTSAMLIMLGTSLKLPLSTTFVTFMVAMGTSLSDRAWGKENAVSRVSGVLTVIGGWFMTAVIASMTAAFVATIVYLGKIPGILIMVIAVVALVMFFNRIHKKREEEYLEQLREIEEMQKNPSRILEKSLQTISHILERSARLLQDIHKGFVTGKKKHFRNTKELVSHMTDEHVHTISQLVQLAKNEFSDKDMVTLHAMTNIFIRSRNVVQGINRVRQLGMERSDTFENPLTKDEAKDIESLGSLAVENLDLLVSGIKEGKPRPSTRQGKELMKLKEEIQDNQIRRLKDGKSKLSPSISYLLYLDEMVEINENLVALLSELRILLPISFTSKQEKSERKTKVEKAKPVVPEKTTQAKAKPGRPKKS